MMASCWWAGPHTIYIWNFIHHEVGFSVLPASYFFGVYFGADQQFPAEGRGAGSL